MRYTWGEPTPEERKAAKEKAQRMRKRARTYLSHFRSQLPKLSRKQSSIVVDMLIRAYDAGVDDTRDEWSAADCAKFQDDCESKRERALRGVQARRAKSTRMAIRAEFKTARDAGKSITAKQLAKKHGASLPTVYRALHGLLKQPKG